MRRPELLAALIAAFVLAAPSAAHALWRHQDRAWCALLYVQSILDCSYDTLAQCNAMVSGVGGQCQPNFYSYRPEPKPRRYTRRPKN